METTDEDKIYLDEIARADEAVVLRSQTADYYDWLRQLCGFDTFREMAAAWNAKAAELLERDNAPK